MTGTWVLDEVRLAVENVYKILEINEAYECEVTQYNPEPGGGDLFSILYKHISKIKRRLASILTGFEAPKTKSEYSFVLRE